MKANRKICLGIILASLIGLGMLVVVRALDSAYAPENVALRNALAGCDRIQIEKWNGLKEGTVVATLQRVDAARFTQSIQLTDVGRLKHITHFMHGPPVYTFHCYQGSIKKCSIDYMGDKISCDKVTSVLKSGYRIRNGYYQVNWRSKRYLHRLL